MTGRLCPMSTASDDSAGAGPRAPVVPQRRHTGRLVAVIITVLAVILVVVGTKVVPDEEIAAETADFDKETFGAENFPDIQAGIVERAVDAPELAEALESDPEGTAEEHGNEVDGKTVYSTSFTARSKRTSRASWISTSTTCRRASQCGCRRDRPSTVPSCGMRPETSTSASSPTRSNSRTPEPR